MRCTEDRDRWRIRTGVADPKNWEEGEEKEEEEEEKEEDIIFL